ncbi:hypothetical protein ACS0TY_023755 [Phlomoides rotata]
MEEKYTTIVSPNGLKSLYKGTMIECTKFNLDIKVLFHRLIEMGEGPKLEKALGMEDLLINLLRIFEEEFRLLLEVALRL